MGTPTMIPKFIIKKHAVYRFATKGLGVESKFAEEVVYSHRNDKEKQEILNKWKTKMKRRVVKSKLVGLPDGKEFRRDTNVALQSALVYVFVKDERNGKMNLVTVWNQFDPENIFK
jgi:hypothetical protein